MTISTFESLFSGKRELFKGLAVEGKLGTEKFAPRPVISLDMSAVSSTEGLEGFRGSLNAAAAETARRLGVSYSSNLSPSTAFSLFIRACHDKYKKKAAVLIDEYDAPAALLLGKQKKIEDIRRELIEFYAPLKACDRYLSFVLAAGAVNLEKSGLCPAFNHATDISMEPEYGAMAGFTEDEVKKHFVRQLGEAAKAKGIPEDALFGLLKKHCNGFCFDGKTFLYSPHSLSHFFSESKPETPWL